MRIVSLISSATEILFGIGAGPDVVAISHECDYPPEATSLPRATRSQIDSSQPSQEIDEQVKRLMEAGEALYEIDRNLIRSLQPDLIVTQAQCDVCAVKYQDVVDFVASEPTLRDTSIVALQPQQLHDLFTDIVTLGEAANAWKGAKELKERLYSIFSDVELKTLWPLDGPKPRVAVVEWTEPLMIAGNWTPELIIAAGGLSMVMPVGEASAYASWQELNAFEPEVLVVAPCGFGLERSIQEAQRLAAREDFQRLPAVANGRAFVVDGNAYLNRSGPRLIDTLLILAHLIRPDLFGPPAGELAEGRAWVRLA
jgi:iron complex transport system substrate-binding protein